MRSITPIIAIVILLLVTISAVTPLYLWVQKGVQKYSQKATKTADTTFKSITNLEIADIKIYKKYDGALALWYLDEGFGNIVDDYSNNNYKLKFEGSPRWVKGVLSNALEFNGNSSLKGNYQLLVGKTKWSITLITKPYSLANYTYAEGTTDGDKIVLEIANNKFRIAISNNSVGWQRLSSSLPLSKNEWYFVAVTYDGDNLKICVNNVCNSTSGIKSATTGGGTVKIANGVYANYPYKGVIDEIYLYNEPLDNKTIENLYYRLTVRVVNPNDRPIKIEGYYQIEDPETGNIICEIPLKYKETFITDSGSDLIKPSKEETIRMVLFYKDKHCSLNKWKTYNFCLTNGINRVCKLFHP
ncbi:NEQ500 [Nanoarchaeum equitans Kin4-M]|uniref:NEQ500 n=1 Tax=Nanoarchaeum equitans (strain Kin4-M) TaxID=228908 RepID=Q74MW2_NANEQ|nr:NEQ500 [Nanoarchaeum equitans Kin4-M]